MKITTASEHMFAMFYAFWARIASLSPYELWGNFVFTALTVAILFGAAFLTRRILTRGNRNRFRAAAATTSRETLRGSRSARIFLTATYTVLFVVGLILVSGIWGIDVLGLASNAISGRIAGTVLKILLLVVITFAAVEVAAFLVNRTFRGLSLRTRELRREAQLNTLAPLLRAVLQIVFVGIGVLTILSEIGVQTGPLIAGIGVVGVAIGFGAQTLVKDFITGIFLIIEDTVSVGDIVQIGGFGGLVEDMSLRTIRLRDFDGTLHVFPYGEAQIIHNMTKEFSYTVFNFKMSYETDVGRALEIMKATGDALQKAPGFADKILGPIEISGIDALSTDGVTVQSRIKTKPSAQWNVGREFNRRVLDAFERAGIKLPHKTLAILQPAPTPSASPELAAPKSARGR